MELNSEPGPYGRAPALNPLDVNLPYSGGLWASTSKDNARNAGPKTTDNWRGTKGQRAGSPRDSGVGSIDSFTCRLFGKRSRRRVPRLVLTVIISSVGKLSSSGPLSWGAPPRLYADAAGVSRFYRRRSVAPWGAALVCLFLFRSRSALLPAHFRRCSSLLLSTPLYFSARRARQP